MKDPLEDIWNDYILTLQPTSLIKVIPVNQKIHIALQEQQFAYLQILKDVEMPHKFSTRQLYHPNSKCLHIALLKYNSLFRL